MEVILSFEVFQLNEEPYQGDSALNKVFIFIIIIVFLTCYTISIVVFWQEAVFDGWKIQLIAICVNFLNKNKEAESRTSFDSKWFSKVKKKMQIK